MILGLRRAVTLVMVVASLAVVASTIPVAAGTASPHAFDPLELPDVARLKAMARAGEHPRFSWREAAGASEYAVVVQDLRGRPYWAWRGPETTVFLGGLTQPPDDAAGPILTKRAQWQVVAYAPDGRIVAASPWKVVAPR